MRVIVGPVAAESATAWLSYAAEVVDGLDRLAPGECYTAPEVRQIFHGYLTEWQRVARGPIFLWEADIPAEQVEYHMHAFQKVADMLAEREQRTGVSHAPEEGKEFYSALLTGVLTALEAEGPSHAAFAQHLGEFWPGHQPIS